MIKFSVKKTMTIFVCVIVIIALGVVSILSMTPNLLPNMDMPYMVIVTTYIGATPEEVELGVTKPLEKSLATLENLKNISSISYANYSMVILEFEQTASMDTAVVNAMQSINQVSGTLPSMAGTPYLMKINPNMIPVSVASVTKKGADVEELSEFVSDELLEKLEGTSGVASIETGGILEEKINVKINQEKIDALNDKLAELVNTEIAKGRVAIREGLEQVNAGLIEIQNAEDEANAQIAEIPETYMLESSRVTKEKINELLEDPRITGYFRELLEESLTVIPDSVYNPIYFIARQKYDEGMVQIKEARAELLSAKAELEEAEVNLDIQLEEALKKANIGEMLTITMVSQILQAQNFNMPAGYIVDEGNQFLVSVGDKIKTLEETENLLLLEYEGIGRVTLSDVADIFETDNSSEIYASINGEPGVLLTFSKQSNYATSLVSNNLKAKYEKLENEYEGLDITILMDQGDYIYLIIDAILESLIYGAIFAIFVLFIFLRDIKPTIITLLSIPISIMLSIALMYFSGVTINLISLSGLAVSVGMLVDNSIVVIENIYRFRRDGIDSKKAAVAGTKEVAGAIISSTLTTVCVFAPIVFVTGLTRQLFTDMALTITYSLVASLLIALTLVPAMSSVMLTKGVKEEKKGSKKFRDVYKKVLSWNLRHKFIVLIIAIGLLGYSVYASISKGFIFIPDMTTPQMTGTIEMQDEDATIEEIGEVCDKALEKMKEVDGVQTVGAMVGSGGMMLSMGTADDKLVTIYAILEDGTKRTSSEIAEDLKKAAIDLPINVEIETTSSLTSYMSMGSGTGVTVKVYAEDLSELQDAAKVVAETMQKVDGILEVDDGIGETTPEYHFTVDKEAAVKQGLTVAQVYLAVNEAMTKSDSSVALTLDGKEYQIVVSEPGSDMLSLEELENLVISYTNALTGEEGEVKLSDIATLSENNSLPEIDRSSQRRYISVSGTLKEGHNITLVTSEVEKAIEDIELPSGVTYEFAGENETIMKAIYDLLKMMGLGILLVYLIMVAQFQSLKSPFIIMFTIPLAFTGGLLALLIFGKEISVIAMIGLILLVGVIVNNGIVLVDYTNQLRARGMAKKEAIVEAAATRIRPVLMTSLTTILGLVIMAIGKTAGTDMMQPIALVCIGGLAYATALTLLVVPVIYDIMNGEKYKVVKEADLDITGIILE